MSTELRTQIREYAVGVEDGQEPITVDEVRLHLDRRDETDPVVGLRPPVESRLPMRRPWPAVVAAVVILVIFGVFVFVFPGDEPVPPAESLPDPVDRETGYYVPSDVPEGFVLQDMEASQFSSRLFYFETSGAWLPGDGGFQIGVPFISSAGLPEDPEEYLSGIVESNAGASRVEAGGRPGVIREAEYVDGPVSTRLVSLVAVDEQGGVFEVAAVGMTREEVLAVGGGVDRVPLEEFVDLGSTLEWEFRLTDTHSGFAYELPDEIESLARDVDVFLGLDVLARSDLARSDSNEAPVITTDDGSIVEPEAGAPRSSIVSLYLDVPDGEVEQVFESLRNERVTVSPQVADELTDRYVEKVRDGVVLSEDPYVIQAPTGPEPQFDVSALGEELPLEPAESVDVLPESMFRGLGPVPLATEGRPVIVIGTATRQPSGADPVTAVLWFSEWGGVNLSSTRGSGVGSSGGTLPLERYGITGESRSSMFATSDMSYSVPLETAVVQFITDEGTYWQRPIAGYGVISQKYTEDPRPTSIIAFDAEGNQLGEWEVPPG